MFWMVRLAGLTVSFALIAMAGNAGGLFCLERLHRNPSLEVHSDWLRSHFRGADPKLLPRGSWDRFRRLVHSELLTGDLYCIAGDETSASSITAAILAHPGRAFILADSEAHEALNAIEALQGRKPIGASWKRQLRSIHNRDRKNCSGLPLPLGTAGDGLVRQSQTTSWEKEFEACKKKNEADKAEDKADLSPVIDGLVAPEPDPIELFITTSEDFSLASSRFAARMLLREELQAALYATEGEISFLRGGSSISASDVRAASWLLTRMVSVLPEHAIDRAAGLLDAIAGRSPKEIVVGEFDQEAPLNLPIWGDNGEWEARSLSAILCDRGVWGLLEKDFTYRIQANIATNIKTDLLSIKSMLCGSPGLNERPIFSSRSAVTAESSDIVTAISVGALEEQTRVLEKRLAELQSLILEETEQLIEVRRMTGEIYFDQRDERLTAALKAAKEAEANSGIRGVIEAVGSVVEAVLTGVDAVEAIDNVFDSALKMTDLSDRLDAVWKQREELEKQGRIVFDSYEKVENGISTASKEARGAGGSRVAQAKAAIEELRAQRVAFREDVNAVALRTRRTASEVRGEVERLSESGITMLVATHAADLAGRSVIANVGTQTRRINDLRSCSSALSAISSGPSESLRAVAGSCLTSGTADYDRRIACIRGSRISGQAFFLEVGGALVELGRSTARRCYEDR